MKTLTSPSHDPAPDWSPGLRVGFRFACVYFLLFLLPSPLDDLPGLGKLATLYEKPWLAAARWVGARVLHVGGEISSAQTGSGDKAYDWVRLLLVAVVALVATVAWSLLDERRRYPRLWEVLRVYLRYAVATSMLGYGFAKVLMMQFQAPGPARLLEAFGESSPMGLLWTFMGFSRAYNVFTGGLEVLGGALLFFRRTTVLGALVVVGVMSNVVMLNFCYDVPVKILSVHVVLMALVILAPDLQRLASFLLLDRATAPAAPRAPLPARWMERARLVTKALYIGWVLLSSAALFRSERADVPPHRPLSGTYVIEPSTAGSAPRFRAVTVNDYGYLSLLPLSGPRQLFKADDDAEKKTLTLRSRGGAVSVLTYAQPDGEHLVLEGTLEGEPQSLRLRRFDVAQLPLTTRGFHWVSEIPFNR